MRHEAAAHEHPDVFRQMVTVHVRSRNFYGVRGAAWYCSLGGCDACTCMTYRYVTPLGAGLTFPLDLQIPWNLTELFVAYDKIVHLLHRMHTVHNRTVPAQGRKHRL